MINILYIHGLGSSSKSSTGQLFYGLNDDKYTFFNPSFSLSPRKALEEINQFIKEKDIDIVIGSSLGGFYALQSDCRFGVVINPALTPIKDILTAIGYGEHQYVNGEGKYIIDDDFIEDLKWIIRRKTNRDNPYNDWFKDFDKSRVFGGIFGAQDELFSHYEDFHSINSDSVVLLGNMHHRFEKEYLPLLMVLIEEIAKYL